jgi:hypothetical protein
VRLLRDVLRVVRAEQPGQPHQFGLPRGEQPGDGRLAADLSVSLSSTVFTVIRHLPVR